jgi:hypothetical protein
LKNLVLINATASKTGGAETIIRTFINELKNRPETQYVILTPLEFEDLPGHITYIYKSTTGVATILFATLGIYKLIKRYNPVKVISFTNLNSIFHPHLGITYFHQFKLLESGHSDLKLKIYDIVIRNFLKKNHFIVQTDFVKSAFIKKYPFSENLVISCWPGFNTLTSDEAPSLISEYGSKLNPSIKYSGVLPIAQDSPHKNVRLIKEMNSFWESNFIQIYTCLSQSSDYSSLINLGTLSRQQLFKLYQEVNFMVFPSKSETVGLPIFEFLKTGKPTFILAADYAVRLYDQFEKPDNMILFTDVENFKGLFLQHIDQSYVGLDTSRGEWNKIIELYETNHPII